VTLGQGRGRASVVPKGLGRFLCDPAVETAGYFRVIPAGFVDGNWKRKFQFPSFREFSKHQWSNGKMVKAKGFRVLNLRVAPQAGVGEIGRRIS